MLWADRAIGTLGMRQAVETESGKRVCYNGGRRRGRIAAGGSQMRDAVILLGVLFVLSRWTFVVGHQLGIEFFTRLTWAVPTAYSFSAFTGASVVAALIGAALER